VAARHREQFLGLQVIVTGQQAGLVASRGSARDGKAHSFILLEIAARVSACRTLACGLEANELYLDNSTVSANGSVKVARLLLVPQGMSKHSVTRAIGIREEGINRRRLRLLRRVSGAFSRLHGPQVNEVASAWDRSAQRAENKNCRRPNLPLAAPEKGQPLQ